MARSPHHLADELERASANLDTLIGAVRAGIRNARHYDELEELGQAAAERIVQAFRGSTARPGTADVVPGKKSGVWLR